MNSLRAYRSVGFAGIAIACSLAGDMAIYTVLPIIYLDIGLTALQVGIILAANRFIRILTNPLADRLIGRFSARTLMYASLFVGGVIALLYSFMPSFPFLLILRLFWGLCWSVLRHVGIMNASGKATERLAARMTGTYSSIVRIGLFTGTLLSGILLDATRYEIMFACMACIIFTGFIPATIAFRRREMVAVGRSNAGSRPTINSKALSVQAIKGFVVGAVGPGFVMSTLGQVLHTAAGTEVAIGQMVIGVASLNGMLLSIRALVGIIGGPTLGIAVDKIGIRNGETIAFIGGAAALLTALVAPGILMVTFAVVAFSIFETAAQVALVAETSRTSRGYAMYASAADFGAAAGPLFAWILIGTASVPRVGYLVGALLYVAAMLLVVIDGMNHRAGRNRVA